MIRMCPKCGHEIVGKNALRWGKTTAGTPVIICAGCRRAWDRERKREKKIETILAEVRA